MLWTAFFAALLLPLSALAGEPVVLGAQASAAGGTWRFDVTVEHADTGWDHYADAWEVLTPDGARLGLRELLHPHVEEQPFTRSLSGTVIPDDITQVQIRARDSVHGWGDPIVLDLPR